MKRYCLIAVIFLAVASFASAQNYTTPNDVLGAHLNYGRGCAACHAPHSGAWGNGISPASPDLTTGDVILWGEDVSNLYGRTILFSGGGSGPYSETLPTSMASTTPDVTGLLTCLSCHDGNYTQAAMMQNKVYEALPPTYGAATIPTLLDKDGTTPGASTGYLNDHPVGLNAVFSCTGSYNWDCSVSSNSTSGNTKITVSMTGPNSSRFFKNYGFFVSLGDYEGIPVVVCTTCHNQHVMNVVNVTSKTSSGLSGTYQTMFFLRGPYNPASTNTGANTTAQFCRQCHGGESNEANGSSMGTVL